MYPYHGERANGISLYISIKRKMSSVGGNSPAPSLSLFKRLARSFNVSLISVMTPLTGA